MSVACNAGGECGVIYQKRVGQNMPQLPGFNKSVMQSYPLGIRRATGHQFFSWHTDRTRSSFPCNNLNELAPRRSTACRAYYSFDYGPIHFLELDTETPYLPGSLQNQ